MPARTDSSQTDSRRPGGGIDDYLLDEFEDPFASPEPEGSSKKRKEPEGAGLGIDEEITVKKQAREPRVKLDESRLLSDKGIPTLRKRAKDLKLKGKGHEFSDAARLLSFYQLWLDDLFPKAKFLDALVMVEKAGHGKSMHKLRMDWINELKPKAGGEDTTEQSIPENGAAVVPPAEPTPGDIFGDGDDTAAPRTEATGSLSFAEQDAPDGDDLDALMAEAEATSNTARPAPAAPSESLFGGPIPSRGPATTQQPLDEEDDLDALMAESEMHTSTAPSKPNQPTAQKAADFADEEAALAEMDGLW